MKKKKDNQEIDMSQWSTELVTNLGGLDNIISLHHCISRLRFVLKDINLASVANIENMKLTKGVFKANGQFQIVIGTNVEQVYNEFVKNTHVNTLETKAELKTAVQNNQPKKKGSIIFKGVNFLGEIFIPIIPVLVAGGIILGIRNIFETNFDGWSMVEASPFIKGLNDFLWIPAQVCFWWLPVHICWSIFRKMEADQVLGIVIGLTLLVPPLINTYDVVGGAKSDWIWEIVDDLEGGKFDFGFMQYPWKIQYTAQVIPAFAVGIIGAYINRWIKRVSPSYLSQIIVPLVTILPTFAIAMFAVGPAGFIVGSAIAYAFKLAFTDTVAKYFFGFIVGGIYAPIVVTGMHHMFNAVFVQETASNGGNFLFIAACSQAIAQGGAVLGWMIMNHKTEKAKDVGAPAVVSAYLGVTEPAMYGINIRYMYPFVAACLASAIGTELAVIAGVSAFNSGNGAWLGVLNVQASSQISGVNTWIGTGYTWFMIAMVVNTGVAIGGTMLLSKVKYFKKFDVEIAAAASFEPTKKVVKEPKVKTKAKELRK